MCNSVTCNYDSSQGRSPKLSSHFHHFTVLRAHSSMLYGIGTGMQLIKLPEHYVQCLTPSKIFIVCLWIKDAFPNLYAQSSMETYIKEHKIVNMHASSINVNENPNVILYQSRER